jgi:uncharacterized membrane protein YdjX (TVP38/TMEM64 family)
VKSFKQILRWIWIAGLVSILVICIINPSVFSAAYLKNFLDHFEGYVLLAYFTISVVRGLALIPSTPFVLAGALLFPDKPLVVLTISMIGIMGAAVFVYYFANYIELDRIIHEKHAGRFEQVKDKMNRYGFWIVTAWAFFPAVPTDIISYAAGVTKMKFWKFMLGIFVGELILVSIYIYSGKALFEWLF